MGNDMVVALARATVDGHTLFGHNANRPRNEGQALVRTPARAFAPGEVLRTPNLLLPQVRHTHAVLAGRPGGAWGYQHGVNEHGVAVGVTSIRTRLWSDRPGLTGSELVRLALERAASACQAVDVLTNLVGRFGQGVCPDSGRGDEQDSAFLIADGREAFVLEACGAHWALQMVREVRAMSDVCQIRQDWDRISRGLADLAIKRGWWPEDGCKLDFAGSIAHEAVDNPAALRRWGRATLLLEQHSGQIDPLFIRGVLAEISEEPAVAVGPPHLAGRDFEDVPEVLAPSTRSRLPVANADSPGTAVSLVTHLPSTPGQPSAAWWRFGPPSSRVYFPLFLEGELPAPFLDDGTGGCPLWRQLVHLCGASHHDPALAAALGKGLAGLQERFDQDTREFLAERETLKQRDATEELARLAGSFMQHTVECWQDFHNELCPPAGKALSETEASELLFAIPGA